MSVDDDLIAHLVAQGADPAASRSVRHYVYMPKRQPLPSPANSEIADT